MADQMKNFMIGLFIIAATAIIVFILLFLNPPVGNQGGSLRIRFTDIDKVNVGTRVSYGGKAVGEVIEIIPLYRTGEARDVHDGVVYLYELKLLVDSSVSVLDIDTISLRTSGLLGEKSIEITPGVYIPNQPVTIVNDKILYAKETGSVEQTFKEFKEVADKFDLALDRVADLLKDVKETNLINHIADTFKNLNDISSSLDMPDEWANTVKNINTFSNDLVNTWNTVDEVVTNLDEISTNVKEGKGTVGRLMMEDDLYLHLNSILSKAETTMDDINHYGVLFHTDKGWQRLRARRMNLMEKLSSPQEFRNYFNDEINEINTSLCRVALVLDRTQSACSPWEITNDREFKKVYTELLRRVSELEEGIKMYNQQMMDEQSKKTEIVDCCH